MTHTLLEDWDAENHPVARVRLAQLVDRLSVTTHRDTPVLTVHTTWGTGSPITVSANEPFPGRRWTV